MPIEVHTVRNRQSPGGIIQCSNPDCDGNISRRKFNNFLRFHQQPRCGKCGSVDLQPTQSYEIRDNRLIWSPRLKMVRKFIPGRNK